MPAHRDIDLVSVSPPAQAARGRLAAPEEALVLRLICEQHAVTVGQIGRFLEIYRADAERLVAEFVRSGWVVARELVTGQSPWVWLRAGGVRAGECEFGGSEIRKGSLFHWWAITEARLEVTRGTPRGRWICERQLRREHRKGGGYMPDAIFEVDGERHAIEVELTRKPPEMLAPIVDEHCGRYDAVVYFCSSLVWSHLARLGYFGKYPNLVVRKFVNEPRPLYSRQWRFDGDMDRRVGRRPEEPPEWAVAVLDLLTRQGAISVGQLARFLKQDEASAERIVEYLCEEGWTNRARPFANEEVWVWVTAPGARFSGSGLSAPSLVVGGLERRRAANEVRLLLTEREPSARWISARELRCAGDGLRGPRPDGVVEVNGERHVIDLLFNPPSQTRLEDKLEERFAEYDAVIWFCGPRVKVLVERKQRDHYWPKLILRRLPGSARRRRSARRRKPKPRDLSSAVFREMTVSEVALEALAAIMREASLAAPPKVLAAARRTGSGGGQERLVTDVGAWYVANTSRWGWRARPLSMKEVEANPARPAEELSANAAGKPLSDVQEVAIRLAAAGLSNAEIAEHTGAQVPTVELRLRRAYAKLGISGHGARKRLREMFEKRGSLS